MAVRDILKMGDSRLLRTAQPVTAFDSDALHLLITDLLDTMHAADGAGLAAPQIGVDLQLVIFGSDARNPRFMRAKRIGLIVNASRHIPMYFPDSDVRTYRIPIDDDPRCNRTILRHWPVAVRAIDDMLRSGQGVLVHCRAGMQRSAAVVAAYLMWKRGLTADQAFEYINKRKAETFWPVPTFEVALRAWESTMRT